MNSFSYEEQGTKRYLVYTRDKDDKLDLFTMEMLSNNKIPGLAAFSCIQMDNTIYMKYNITGLKSLSEYFLAPVKRQNFLSLLDSLTDSLISADEYMLNLSSYVFDESYIYTDPSTMKISMVVLPVEKEETRPEDFLKKLLFDVRYDQGEDCSYVASLINLLGNNGSFSLGTFKNQIAGFKSSSYAPAERAEKKSSESYVERQESPVTPSYEYSRQGRPDRGQQQSAAAQDVPVKKHAQDTPEKQECLDILFSDTPDEEPKKTKKGFFSKGKKPEKQGKGFKIGFGKKEGKAKAESSPVHNIKMPLDGLAIPGRDFPGQFPPFGGQREKEAEAVSQEQIKFVSIPAQNLNIQQMEAQQQDFGETVYLEDGSEDTVMIQQNEEEAVPKFVLHRLSTQETFELKGTMIRVGRNPNITEICISGNRGIGRIHAIMYLRDGQVFIADNGSKNKTFVDGEQIRPDEEPRLLLSGSRIRMGDEEFEFRVSR